MSIKNNYVSIDLCINLFITFIYIIYMGFTAYRHSVGGSTPFVTDFILSGVLTFAWIFVFWLYYRESQLRVMYISVRLLSVLLVVHLFVVGYFVWGVFCGGVDAQIYWFYVPFLFGGLYQTISLLWCIRKFSKG